MMGDPLRALEAALFAAEAPMTPAEVAADPRVREVYLGEAQHG